MLFRRIARLTDDLSIFPPVFKTVDRRIRNKSWVVAEYEIMGCIGRSIEKQAKWLEAYSPTPCIRRHETRNRFIHCPTMSVGEMMLRLHMPNLCERVRGMRLLASAMLRNASTTGAADVENAMF